MVALGIAFAAACIVGIVLFVGMTATANAVTAAIEINRL